MSARSLPGNGVDRGAPQQSSVHRPPFFHPGFGCWIVTRYRDARAVLADAATFSSEIAARDSVRAGCPGEIAAALTELIPPGTAQLVTSDPPRHGGMRLVATRLFSPAMLEFYAPRIQRVVDRLMAGLGARAPIDLVTDFIMPFSSQSVLTVLGLEDDEVEPVAQLAHRALPLFFTVPSEPKRLESAEALLTLELKLRDLLRKRRAAPKQDLASRLVVLNRNAGDVMTEAELLQFLEDLAFAGSEPLAAVLSSLIARLLVEKHGWTRATAQRSRLDGIMEEGLRTATGLRGVVRRATCEVEIGGSLIPEGALLMVVTATANRDETQFHDSRHLLGGRPDVRQHLAFGHGRHLCAGAPLARLQMRLAMTGLLERMPNLSLWPEAPLAFATAPMLKQVTRLLVRA